MPPAAAAACWAQPAAADPVWPATGGWPAGCMKDGILPGEGEAGDPPRRECNAVLRASETLH